MWSNVWLAPSWPKWVIASPQVADGTGNTTSRLNPPIAAFGYTPVGSGTALDVSTRDAGRIRSHPQLVVAPK
jgi:hypothetical protein